MLCFRISLVNLASSFCGVNSLRWCGQVVGPRIWQVVCIDLVSRRSGYLTQVVGNGPQSRSLSLSVSRPVCCLRSSKWMVGWPYSTGGQVVEHPPLSLQRCLLRYFSFCSSTLSTPGNFSEFYQNCGFAISQKFHQNCRPGWEEEACLPRNRGGQNYECTDQVKIVTKLIEYGHKSLWVHRSGEDGQKLSPDNENCYELSMATKGPKNGETSKMRIICAHQGKIRCKEGWIGDLCQVCQ